MQHSIFRKVSKSNNLKPYSCNTCGKKFELLEKEFGDNMYWYCDGCGKKGRTQTVLLKASENKSQVDVEGVELVRNRDQSHDAVNIGSAAGFGRSMANDLSRSSHDGPQAQSYADEDDLLGTKNSV